MLMVLKNKILPENISFVNHQNCNDLLHQTQTDIFCHPVAQLYFWGMTICGIIGNILNLYVMIRYFTKSFLYIYLRALAVSDLCVTLTNIPKMVIVCYFNFLPCDQFYYYTMTQRICITSLINVFIATSNLTTLSVTFERFVAVSFPFKWKIYRWKTAKAAKICIAIIWIISFGIYIPQIVIKYLETKNFSTASLKDVNESENVPFQLYKNFREILIRIVPVFLMIIFNIVMLFAVKRNTRYSITTFNISRHASQRNSEDKKLTFMVIALSLLDIICIFPQAIIFIINDHLQSNIDLFYILVCIFDLIEMINYSLTFFMYLLFNRKFLDVLCHSISKYHDSKRLSVISDFGNKINNQDSSSRSLSLSSSKTISLSL